MASWWAVLAPTLRTGVQKIEYIQADSRQVAAEVLPGSTVVGGPYPTQAAAAAANPGTTVAQAGLGATDPASGAPPGTVNATPSTLGGLAAIGDFFSRLTQANTWERVGEVVLGLILIAMGVAHLTHAVPIATKIAKTAGAAAVL